MKVLYVAPKSDFSAQVLCALREHSCDVTWINEREDFAVPFGVGRTSWWWRLRRQFPFLRHRSNDALQLEILKRAVRVDVVLAGKGMNIRRATLEALRTRGTRSAVWFPENCANEPYRSWVAQQANAWDYFISFDSAVYEYVPESMRSRTFVVPFGVPIIKNIHITKQDAQRYSCDVAFIGAPYADRVQLLRRIASSCNLKIWGWNGWCDTDLRQFYHGELNAHESAKVYRMAKICVNTNVAPRTRGVNLKTFEICAAGGFQLTDECADLSQVFIPNVEIATFKDKHDFQNKIQYWLTHDEERHIVAEAGHRRCAKEHTLFHRVGSLLSIIAS